MKRYHKRKTLCQCGCGKKRMRRFTKAYWRYLEELSAYYQMGLEHGRLEAKAK